MFIIVGRGVGSPLQSLEAFPDSVLMRPSNILVGPICYQKFKFCWQNAKQELSFQFQSSVLELKFKPNSISPLQK